MPRTKPRRAMGTKWVRDESSAGSRSDDRVAAQPFDLVDRVAGFLQDLVGVLAQGGRLAIDARAAVLETEARSDQAEGAVTRADGLQHVAVLELRMVHDLVHLPDGSARDVGRGQPRLPGARIGAGHGR